MTRPPTLRVVKVGGSLFDCPDLPALLENWLAAAGEADRNAAPPRSRIDVLVAGGGAMVDQVRQLDQRFALGNEASHWMSIDLMSCTARLLSCLMDSDPPVQSWDDLTSLVAGPGPRTIIFDVQQWLADVEATQPGVRLSHDWRTTSDSIAARLVQVLNADELVMLKSTDNPHDLDWQAAATAGLVDEYFPCIAPGLRRIVWVNLGGNWMQARTR